MTAVIRVLWGNEDSEGWKRVWHSDIQKWRVPEVHPQHQFIYVYGKGNANLLTKAGLHNVVLVNKSPWPDGQIDTTRNGRRPWHNKFHLLEQAVIDHGEIVYCDWDVGYRNQDLGYLESRLEGRQITLVGFKYRQRRHPERREGSRFGISGAWMHLKGLEFIHQVIEGMKRPFPWSWHDELVMGHVLDESHGKWIGEAEWLKVYESPIMVVPACWSPWKTISDDGTTVVKQTPIPFTWERVFS